MTEILNVYSAVIILKTKNSFSLTTYQEVSVKLLPYSICTFLAKGYMHIIICYKQHFYVRERNLHYFTYEPSLILQ